MIGWLAVPAWAAPCPEPTTVDAVASETERVIAAWVSLDAASLYEAADRVERQLECLRDVAPPSLAGAVFRALALERFLASDRAAAEALLRSARSVEPDHVWPVAVLDVDHPLVVASTADRTPASWTALPAGEASRLFVNGEPADRVRADCPFLLQRVGADGRVDRTWVVSSSELPADLLPPARAPLLPPVAEAPLPPPLPTPIVVRHPSRALLASGLATAGLGAVALAGAGVVRTGYRSDPGASGPEPGLVALNYGLGIAGLGLLGSGAGLGVVAVVRDRW